MAELVSEHLPKPIRQTQWARYESGENEPPLAVIEAAAKVSGLPPEWIAFAIETRAISPLVNPFRTVPGHPREVPGAAPPRTSEDVQQELGVRGPAQMTPPNARPAAKKAAGGKRKKE